MAIYEGYEYAKQGKAISMTQLTAPGDTDTVKVMGVKSFVWQYKIASINTSVTVAAYGSLDGTNWFNLDANDATTTKTSNGVYAMSYNGNGEIAYTKFTFISEAGGTSATIDVVFMAGGTAL